MRQFREKPHTKLRVLLDCYGVQGADIAKWLGRSNNNYVSDRMIARKPWTIDEIYIIIENLRRINPEDPPIPYDKIVEYFPPKGLRVQGQQLPA